MKVYVVINSHQHGLGEAVEVDAASSESAENTARAMYDSGILEDEGELESVLFNVL